MTGRDIFFSPIYFGKQKLYFSWFWKKKSKKPKRGLTAENSVDPEYEAIKGAIQKKQSLASIRSRESRQSLAQDDICSKHNWRKTSIDRSSMAHTVRYERTTMADISAELINLTSLKRISTADEFQPQAKPSPTKLKSKRSMPNIQNNNGCSNPPPKRKVSRQHDRDTFTKSIPTG